MEHRHRPLVELIADCREETGRYLRREPARQEPCWEIIRRAVCERDERAWQAFYEQYHGLVRAWVRQRAATVRPAEDDEFLTARAFDRFWTHVGPELIGRFAGLPQLLAYLKLCAFSAVLDETSAVKWDRLAPSPDGDRAPTAVTATGAEASALDALAVEQLRRAVLAEAHTEAERIVARLCFFLGLKPGEVQARHPAVFPSVKDVYRTVRNLKERLQRNPEILRCLAEAVGDRALTPAVERE
jgi:DNA-directed RNA polymerase specialized sigma24 family protein